MVKRKPYAIMYGLILEDWGFCDLCVHRGLSSCMFLVFSVMHRHMVSLLAWVADEPIDL
jgi:hypothetical protein